MIQHPSPLWVRRPMTVWPSSWTSIAGSCTRSTRMYLPGMVWCSHPSPTRRWMTSWRSLQKNWVSPGTLPRCSFLGRPGLMRLTGYVMSLPPILQEEHLWFMHLKWDGLHNWWCPTLDMKTMTQWNHTLHWLTRPGRRWWKQTSDDMKQMSWKGNGSNAVSLFSVWEDEY